MGIKQHINKHITKDKDYLFGWEFKYKTTHRSMQQHFIVGMNHGYYCFACDAQSSLVNRLQAKQVLDLEH